MKHLNLILFLLISTVVHAQDEVIMDSIANVTISASRIDMDVLRTPFSAHKLNLELRQNSSSLNSLNEILNEVPGIFAMNQYNSAQDLRISIRGFGARAAFGIRGVKLIADGIPLSTPDGQGQIDNVWVGGIKEVEVLNGASSALYGNASGGVVSLKIFSDSNDDFNKLNLSLGSYNYQNVAFESHLNLHKLVIDNQLSYVDQDGYRDFSKSRNIIYNGRIKKVISDRQKISFAINALASPYGQDPGGINQETVNEDRRQARPQNETYNAGEELTQIGSSIQYETSASSNDQLKLTGFISRRDFENRLPFENGGQVDLLRNYGGVNLAYSRKFGNSKFENEINAGIGYEYQNDLRIRYNNIEGERGTEALNQNEIFKSASAHITAQSTYGKLLMNGGLRYDNNHIKLKDNFDSNGNDDGSLSLPSLSPSLSWSYEIGKRQYLSTSFSYGFETPALSELSSRPDNMGGLNPDLKPQQSFNYELGYKARFSDHLSLFASFFAINSVDELLPYELEDFPGRTFYRNEGRTNRQGVELNLMASFAKYFSISTAFTYSNFKFTDDESHSLPGIPVINYFINLKVNKGPLYISFQHRYLSEFYADNENETKIDQSLIGNLSLSYQVKNFRPFVGINNIYNTKYFDNVRLNAFGGRFYEAAPPRNFYLGVNFDF